MTPKMPHYNDAEKHQAFQDCFICLLLFPYSQRQRINGNSCFEILQQALDTAKVLETVMDQTRG